MPTHYQLCREAGRCISCPKPSPKHARCDTCRQKRKDIHAENKANKHCVECKEPHKEPGSRCPQCKKEHVRLYKERKARGVCPHCGGESIAKPGSHCKKCQKKNRKRDRKKYAKLRGEVLQAYGGDPAACKCCGTDIVEFLQVDHIRNDGGKHRRELSGKNQGCNIYTWLRKHNYPKGFQTLCGSCHNAKTHHGLCPHQRRDRYTEADLARIASLGMLVPSAGVPA